MPALPILLGACVLLLIGPARAVADGPVLLYDFDAIAADGHVPNAAGPEMAGKLVGAARSVMLEGAEARSVLVLDGATGGRSGPWSASASKNRDSRGGHMQRCWWLPGRNRTATTGMAWLGGANPDYP